ncbi:DUF1740-domain-containing protein [Xylariaceae sp. FL0594]|nr:DUF1740-domain-containing protein [Xylariaceae sp. FL0594]
MSSHGKTKPSSVPKFTSFRPKAQESSQEAAGEATVEGHTTRRGRPTEQGVPHRPGRSPLSQAAQLPTERKAGEDVPYIFDKRGDPLIRQYGGNDPRAIPPYRRIGAGRVLGLDGFMRTERIGSREEFYIVNHFETRALLSSDKKSLSAKGIRPDRPSIRVRRRKSEATAGTEDFLPLKTSRKRKRGGLASDESSGEDGPSYRSIHGKSKSHEHSDSDDAFDSDASDNALLGGQGDPVTVRSIELSRKVREHPEDVESWLELVNYQDNLLSAQSAGHAPTAAEIRSFADIKLSLLEQALSHCTDNALREKLNVKVMTEGVKVWELKAAAKKFKEILQQYPKSFDLWKLYISFQQTTLSAFNYKEVKRLYTDKLHSLTQELLNHDIPGDQIGCSEQIIYVFLRLTRFLADTGFVELASAAWQATLELNLMRPSMAADAGADVPPSFQEFWESEVPRLGEAGWKGWAAFMAGSDAQEPPAPKISDTLPITPDTRDGYKAWHTVECQKSREAAVPARTLDDGAEDDPFRVVMYSDIQDMLLYFRTGVIPYIARQLVDAFLIYSHLPPSVQREGVLGEAVKDTFIVRSLRTLPFSDLSPTSYADKPQEQEDKLPEFHHAVEEMNLTPEIMFPSARWFRYMGQMRGVVSPGHYEFVSTVLMQITRKGAVAGLGPYALAFEAINEPGNEKKSAKALLKLDPVNVDLYLGYSILEYERGNKAAARNVLSAALGLPSLSAHDRVRLGIAAAWHELEDGELAMAVSQLCRLTEESSSSLNPANQDISGSVEATPSQILKARQWLVTSRDYKISSGEIAQAVIYAEGSVLLEYLTKHSEKEPRAPKQGDIWSAIVSINQCSEELVSRGLKHSPSHEQFLQFAARLLYYHASHGSFRPGLFREQLTQYLTFFPRNTVFLSLLAWRSDRLTNSINDRVRALLHDHVLTRENESSLAAHVFAIAHELETGTAHSARAAFERALTSSSSFSFSASPGLWIAYIRLCHARKELRGSTRGKEYSHNNNNNNNNNNNSKSKAKDVFYRAIQACPYSKDVFMEAFGTLVRDFDTAELKSVYAAMTRIGFRIHVELDEFVENWRRQVRERDRVKEKEKERQERKRDGDRSHHHHGTRG